MGIFDQIKAAFSSNEDRDAKADLGQKPRQKAAENPELAAEAAPPAAADTPISPQIARNYTVQSGDTLYKIAEELYGSGDEYEKIFEANRETLDSPDHIKPGQKLNIP